VITTCWASTAVASVVTIASASTTVALMLGHVLRGSTTACSSLSRHPANILNGMTPEESVPLAMGTAGSSVVFAALTVIIALCGLSVVGIPFLTVMGVSAACSVFVALLIALTLLPAMLGLRRPKVRQIHPACPVSVPRAERVARRSAADPDSPFGARWARFVVRRPGAGAHRGIALLGVLAIPALRSSWACPAAPRSPPTRPSARRTTSPPRASGLGFNGAAADRRSRTSAVRGTPQQISATSRESPWATSGATFGAEFRVRLAEGRSAGDICMTSWTDDLQARR